MAQTLVQELARISVGPDLAKNSRIKVRGHYTFEPNFDPGGPALPRGTRIKAILALVRTSGRDPVVLDSDWISRYPRIINGSDLLDVQTLFDVTNRRIRPVFGGTAEGGGISVSSTATAFTASQTLTTDSGGSPTHTHTITIAGANDLGVKGFVSMTSYNTTAGAYTLIADEADFQGVSGSAMVEAVLTENDPADRPYNDQCVAMMLVCYKYDPEGDAPDAKVIQPPQIDGTDKWPGLLVSEFERYVEVFDYPVDPHPPGTSFSGGSVPLITAGSEVAVTFTVSGITDPVTAVRLDFTDFTHAFPSDVAMILVGPGGQGGLVFSGGATDASTNVDFTITDYTGSSPWPSSGVLSAGTYRGRNRSVSQSLGSRTFTTAPTISGVNPTPGSESYADFSDFNGVDPNGTWTLYIGDFSGADDGSIGNVSLTIGHQK